MRWSEVAKLNIVEGQEVSVPSNLYHVSETIKEADILTNGLHSNDRESFYKETSYQQRIYFFTRCKPEAIMDYVGELFGDRYGCSINRDRQFLLVPYTVFEIDATMLSGFAYFSDPVSFSDAVAIYTESGDVPPEAISVKYKEEVDHRAEVGLI